MRALTVAAVAVVAAGVAAPVAATATPFTNSHVVVAGGSHSTDRLIDPRSCC